MLSAPAIQFKGSGWYVTDYAKSSSAGSSSDSKSGESAAGEKPAAGDKTAAASDGKSKPKPAPVTKGKKASADK